jgi:hypothetical protein
MFKDRFWVPSLAGLSLLAAACGTVDVEDADVEWSMPQNLLTSIALADGGSVDFHEPVPGELTVIYVGREAEYRHVFDDLERGVVTHAQVYEALSGQKAPAALVEAEARSFAARANPPEDADATSSFDAPPSVAAPSTVDGIGTIRAAMTAGDFIDDCCSSGWGFLYCWTSRTGSGSVTRTSLSMYTHLNAYDGSVTHKMEYENVWGNMVTYVSNVVPEGYISYISRSGLWTTRKTSISQADSNGYHVSIYGTN